MGKLRKTANSELDHAQQKKRLASLNDADDTKDAQDSGRLA